jgi:PKD repeat protein
MKTKNLIISIAIILISNFSMAQNCNASFTYSVNNLTVTVNNTSTGNYCTAYWYFGDGLNGILATSNPFSHTYSQSGGYHIILALSIDSSYFSICDSVGSTVNVGSSGINDDALFDKNFIIFPNPANDIITIDFPKYSAKENAVLEIQSMDGKLFKSQQVSGIITEVNLNNISSGIYLIKVIDNNGVAVRKMIKE